jgi:hypothetical protein
MATHISILDGASPELRALAREIGVARTGPVVGRAVSNLVKSHLIARNSSHPNSIGGKRTNFWTQAARSTQMQPTSTGAEVSINQIGFRLQWQGGEIKPVKKRYLTIPAVPEAHGMTAGEFDDLEFAIVKDATGHNRPALVRAPQTQIRIGKTKRGLKVTAIASLLSRVIYWLVRRATISAHPEALPPRESMISSARDALTAYLERIIKRRSAT